MLLGLCGKQKGGINCCLSELSVSILDHEVYDLLSLTWPVRRAQIRLQGLDAQISYHLAL